MICSTTLQRKPLSEPILIEKALQNNEMLNSDPIFKAGLRCVHRFKERHVIWGVEFCDSK